MRFSPYATQFKMPICLGILLAFAIAVPAWPQARADFSGVWKQDNDRCQPKRTGDITLRIEHRDPQLIVDTSISRNSSGTGHARQTYTTDGKISVSTGADGDEFHTSIEWQNSSLVFSIEEHEDGRILLSKETWSILEDGVAIERIRERPDGQKQVIFYRRTPVSDSENKFGFATGEINEDPGNRR